LGRRQVTATECNRQTAANSSQYARDRSGLAYASSALAYLATDLGDWHRAAELHGAAQAFLDQTAEQWEEAEARYRGESLNQLRAQLGKEQFERAYAQGMALSLEEAIDLASGKALPP
jgi:hypothetical protein